GKLPIQVILFNRVLDMWTRHVQLPDSEAHLILTLYTFLSYFHQAFEAVPYLHIHGPKGTGKTTIAKLFEALGFNAQLWVSASPASIFRTIDQLSCLLIFDEMEHLTDRAK